MRLQALAKSRKDLRRWYRSSRTIIEFSTAALDFLQPRHFCVSIWQAFELFKKHSQKPLLISRRQASDFVFDLSDCTCHGYGSLGPLT
jgi:hypothetical protein